MERPLTILISGLGIAGPTLAYWLLRRGHQPVLVERMPELRVGGHAVDIRGTALDVTERMGLAAAVREARTDLLTLSAVRPDGRRSYDVARIGVEFERGASREVDVVVGADGQHSALRELVFGPEREFTHHLGAYLSIYTVDNLLGLRDRAVLYNEPGRAAAIFTVRGNERAKVVLLFRSDPLDIDFMDGDSHQELLRRRFAGMGWETGRLLEAMPDAYDFYFDEMSQVRLPSWSTGRVALLGDAAFGPSPMSGQGTSLALIGGYLLANHIATAADLPTAFTLWECGFRPNVDLNQRLATDGMATLLPDSRLGIFARNQTMRVLPLLARYGRGFGGRIERASRAVTLPD